MRVGVQNSRSGSTDLFMADQGGECACVCVWGGVPRTSRTRLSRSALVRVTAVTSAPQRTSASAVALPMPEKTNIHKHKETQKLLCT
jgi:hypothetical protein